MTPALTLSEALHFGEHYLNSISFEQYIDSVDDTLRFFMKTIYENSRYHPSVDDPLTIIGGVDENMRLDAYVDIIHEDKISINISRGTYIALQDLCFRAVSSGSFFNASSDDHEYRKRWRGSSCRQPFTVFEPLQRYHDYIINGVNIDPRLKSLWLRAGLVIDDVEDLPWMSLVVKKIPVDEERVLLATSMLNICLYWIFLHEEAHYRQGHFQLPEDEKLDATDHDGSRLTKAAEFQADKAATQGIANIFFTDKVHASLPRYATKDWSWLTRFILTSLGVVFIAMDIGRRTTGLSARYPSPRTRFLSAVRGILYHTALNGGYRAAKHDWRLGRANEKNRFTREIRALHGALWDLTELQMLVDEDVSSNADPLWPLHDAFPTMAVDAIYFSGTNLADDAAIKAMLNDSGTAIAKMMPSVFNVDDQTALEFRKIATSWAGDLTQLISDSDQLLLRTEEHRKWDVRD